MLGYEVTLEVKRKVPFRVTCDIRDEYGARVVCRDDDIVSFSGVAPEERIAEITGGITEKLVGLGYLSKPNEGADDIGSVAESPNPRPEPRSFEARLG